MINKYGSSSENIIAYIGPHIGGCCYEVGDEVRDKFSSCSLYDNADIIRNRKLDLEKCIVNQLISKGVTNENINGLNLCTFCNNEYELYSYRKSNGNCGRMFSFIFLK